jgi:predicted N-acyltransferase
MMASDVTQLEFNFIAAIAEVSATEWDALVSDGYPFVRHAFLSALESSGAVATDKGWQAHHLIIRSEGKLLGALPLYLKGHSYGEYVFDWAWADAYQRHGQAYYPKLLSAIPFTPATGPRLLLAAELNLERVSALQNLLVQALQQEARRLAASSVHILFSDADWSKQWQGQGLMQRVGAQYHWFDQGYHDFDGFLASFSSRKRKTLRKERRVVAEQGLVLQRLEGEAISASDWQFFFHCYQLTYAKRSGHGGYLPEDFFRRLAADMPDALVMVVAYHDDKRVAAALNFRGGETLYGRYWGCVREFEFLHFEACYYQGIDYCLANGLRHFDPGAQGEHKIQRGFTPITTYSNHWLAEPAFSEAVARFLEEERIHIDAYLEEAATMLPFKRG